MDIVFYALVFFVFLTSIVIIFQICLAIGLPWGAASMGGKFPGKYPPKMRFVAVLNSFILFFITIIVISRTGYLFSTIFPFSKLMIWFIVLFFCIATIMNSITPSKIERIWIPVLVFQAITCIIIALN